jgi:2-haloacid dehalogenase
VIDFDRFRVVTFDCYGTLIDWEAGIVAALRSVLEPRAVVRDDDQLLELFARIEAPLQAGPYRPYREVLDLALAELCHRLGFQPTPAEVGAISRSLPTWKPFPDTVAALSALKQRFQLGVISNVDDELFAHSARLLETPFDWVVTAEQVRTYKPARNNFHRALERIGLPWDQVLHVAQSLFHDIAPARSLGLATVWVDRRGNRPGSGATPAPPPTARPDLVVPDLASLVGLIGL